MRIEEEVSCTPGRKMAINPALLISWIPGMVVIDLMDSEVAARNFIIAASCLDHPVPLIKNQFMFSDWLYAVGEKGIPLVELWTN